MTPTTTSFDHLQVYKITCVLAVVAFAADGYLSDQRWNYPDIVLNLRLALIVIATALFVALSTNKAVQQFSGELILLACIVAYFYCAIASQSTNQGIDEVLGSILTLCASATIFHRISLVLTALLSGTVIYLFYALQVPDPEVSFEKFAVTILLFTSVFFVMISSNITARRKQSQSEQIANAWFDSAADALIRTTTDASEPFKVNKAAIELFGTADQKEIIDRLLAAFLKEQQPEKSREMWLQNATDLDELDEVLALQTVQGAKFWGDLSIRKIQIGEEQLTLARISDVSARINHDQAREAAILEAEKAVHTRTRFLANMSHEIRTPMNGVIGMTSLLLDTQLNDQQREFLDTIRMSGDSLLSIINEILDFSKIEADQIELDIREFDLERCIVDALSIVGPAARDKGLELVLGMDARAPYMYKGDDSRIQQVLVNLLSNAVKFTSSGAVSVKVTTTVPVRENKDCKVMFDVVDSGVGIEASKLSSLFDPFTQADSSTTRKFGGTGLGLTISKRLAILMGGDVSVTSQPGQGSCFSFSCSLGLINPPLKVGAFEILNTKRLLLICSETAKPLSEFTLSGLNLDITTRNLEQPTEAIEDPETFELVMVDANDEALPNLQALLRDANIQAPLLVVAPIGSKHFLTGEYAQVVSKPIRPSELVTAMAETLSGEFRDSKARGIEKLPPLNVQNLSFLLAEDNIVNQKVALNMFKRLGIHADAVGNGKEAVEILHQRHYDVVFMDLQMPEMDGITATMEILSRWPERNIPVFALTAHALAEEREKSLAAGMADHLTKPLEM